MDEHVAEIIEYFDLNKTDVSVLRKLAGYSLEVIGISWLKVSTLAKELDVHPRTIQRSLKRLQGLGIIERHDNFRPVKGGNGASVTIICHCDLSPCEVDEKPTLSWLEQALSRIESINLKQYLKKSKLPKDDTYLLDTYVPKDFAKATSYLPVLKTYDLWMKVLRVSKGIKGALTDSDLTTVAIRAWKATHVRFAMGKVRSVEGYFINTFKKIMAQYKVELFSSFMPF